MTEFYISSNKYSLVERKTKHNGTVYDVMFRVVTLDGIERQKKLSGFKNKTLAKQAYLDFVTEKCELVKNNPLKKHKPDKQVPTVGELHRSYIASLRGQNKESSIYGKQSVYDIFIKPAFESRSITDLTKQELLFWQDALWATRNERTGESYSHNYLSRVRANFSTFLSWVEERYSYKNAFKEIKLPKRRAPRTQMQIWTREEFEQFISVVDDPQYHTFFTLLFFTGRRKGEIFALKPEKIDLEKRSILFDASISRKTLDSAAYHETTTKADKTQHIPICDVVVNELQNYKGQAPYFFGGERPLADTSTTRYFQKKCEEAGVKTIRIHDLRHSFVSMLIHLGANYMVVADLIGDTVEQVLKTYAHLYESDKLEIISKIK
ncbi:MAG: site-specific integrase [Ruminococcaceae bacterium]|nr:site-specific integrase [Oscillospiraceae bacterium]